jgi:hypothetical protein
MGDKSSSFSVACVGLRAIGRNARELPQSFQGYPAICYGITTKSRSHMLPKKKYARASDFPFPWV